MVACGVCWGIAMSGAASAGVLHLRPVGLHVHGLGLHRLGVHAPGLRLREPDLHLQQQGICSVLGGPCHPSFCSVFQPGPCIPYYWPPLGENLQLTITTTDDDPANDPGKASGDTTGHDAGKNAGDAAANDTHKSDTGKDAGNTDQAEQKPVDSIGEMFAALRACWVPPPKDEARHGMQYTVRFSFKRDGEMIAPPFVTYVSYDAPADTRNVYRDAVQGALDRCTPLHFSDGMGGAVAGRPIAVRFVDNRTTDQSAH